MPIKADPSPTGDFHDEYEGKGNAYSGEYIASNGDTQTITGTLLPTPVNTPAAATSETAGTTNTSMGTAPVTTPKAAPDAGSSSQTPQAAGPQINGASREPILHAFKMAAALVAVAIFP